MNISILPCMLLFPMLWIPSQSLAQSKEKALHLLKKYDPIGYSIIEEYQHTPRKYSSGGYKIMLGERMDIKEFINSSDFEERLWDQLNTVVHESCHAYSGTLVYPLLIEQKQSIVNAQYYAFFRGEAPPLLVPITPVFTTNEMVDTFPAKLRTLRFNTYINSNAKNLGAQRYGIYGMLDEWNAYYFGTRTSYLSYRYIENKTEGKPSDWLNYMQSVDGTLFAHFEFKFYILKYLLYARTNYPQVYRAILKNEAFQKAFQEINSDFEKLIEDYQQRRETILAQMKKEGYSIELTSGKTCIGSSGIANFMDVISLLEGEVQAAFYQQIEQKILGD